MECIKSFFSARPPAADPPPADEPGGAEAARGAGVGARRGQRALDAHRAPPAVRARRAPDQAEGDATHGTQGRQLHIDSACTG